jgi:hypothetical protein
VLSVSGAPISVALHTDAKASEKTSRLERKAARGATLWTTARRGSQTGRSFPLPQ